MGKSKEVRQHIRKRIVGHAQVWFIFGSNFQKPEGTLFICANNYTQVRWDAQSSYRSGRRQALSQRWTYFCPKWADRPQDKSKRPEVWSIKYVYAKTMCVAIFYTQVGTNKKEHELKVCVNIRKLFTCSENVQEPHKLFQWTINYRAPELTQIRWNPIPFSV